MTYRVSAPGNHRKKPKATTYNRICPYCGKPGARVPVNHDGRKKIIRFAHRRCHGKG